MNRICRICGATDFEKEFVEKQNICRDCRKVYIKDWRRSQGYTKASNGSPRTDLSGRDFGTLHVLRLAGKGKHGYIWLCRCICGVEEEIFDQYIKRIRATCPHVQRKGVPRRDKNVWKGVGEISAVRWNLIKNKAKKRGLEFSINLDFMWNLFLKQNRLCALSGVLLHFGILKEDKWTASLDRKDSSRGYTEDNVQWIHKQVNFMKQALSDREFVEWCRVIVSYNANISLV